MSEDVTAGWEGVQTAVETQTETAETEPTPTSTTPQADQEPTVKPKTISEDYIPQHLGEREINLIVIQEDGKRSEVTVELIDTDIASIEVEFSSYFEFSDDIQQQLYNIINENTIPHVDISVDN